MDKEESLLEEEGETRRNDIDNGFSEANESHNTEVGIERQHTDYEEGTNNEMVHSINSPSKSRDSSPKSIANKRYYTPQRDISTINYAFGEPKIDEAAKEAQDWFDRLSSAGEEENDANKPVFPHGLKYRSAEANLSPQMFDRLHQRIPSGQEFDPDQHPKSKLISKNRNSSVDVGIGLHEEDNSNNNSRAENFSKGRRSAVGNNSSSVYAVLHPQNENNSEQGKRNGRSSHKNQAPKKNHLRDHIAAIAEMSCLTHNVKEEERKEEARKEETIKHWGSGLPPVKVVKKPSTPRKNFMEKNMESISEQSACVKALREEPMPNYVTQKKLGRVPEYLQRIKTELAQEAQRREIEEAAKTCPPGRRLMSEANRRHILQKLENKHKDLIQTLKSFPLMSDTTRLLQMKSDIEQQLRKIEASHRYYDNPKVYTSCLDKSCPTCMCVNSHFRQDFLPRTPPEFSGDALWDHMACAAGIQKSPGRTARLSFDRGEYQDDALGIFRSISPPQKSANQSSEFHVSSSKRNDTSPVRISRQLHAASPSSRWAMCRHCSPPRGSAKHHR